MDLSQREDVSKGFVPRLSLDFDGVVHSYTSGWAGDACIIPDPPVEGAFDFIVEAMDRGYQVCVFSTRSNTPGARMAMRQWMIDHGMNASVAAKVVFPREKPNATLLIDDRAFHFKGRFPTFDYIDGFKPWNKGGESDEPVDLQQALAAEREHTAREKHFRKEEEECHHWAVKRAEQAKGVLSKRMIVTTTLPRTKDTDAIVDALAILGGE